MMRQGADRRRVVRFALNKEGDPQWTGVSAELKIDPEQFKINPKDNNDKTKEEHSECESNTSASNT